MNVFPIPPRTPSIRKTQFSTEPMAKRVTRTNTSNPFTLKVPSKSNKTL